MFDWIKRRKPLSTPGQPPPAASPFEARPGRSDIVLAALLLDGMDFALAEAERALAAEPVSGVPVSDVSTDRGILSLSLGDLMLFVSPMPAPYPWQDLAGPCETSWIWPPDRPATTLKAHRSHVLLTLAGPADDPIPPRVLLTHVAGRLARLPGVAGVYWPEATLAHYPPIFADMADAAGPRSPPLYLWVDYRLFRDDDGTVGCFTTGLAPLGLMEMEITGLAREPSDLRDWAMNVTSYLLDRGGPIPDGDTIGGSAEERFRVTHGPSRFGAPGAVMRIRP